MSPLTVEAPAPQPPNPPHPYPYWARTEPPGSASAIVRPTRKRMRTTMDGLLKEKTGFARAGPDAPMRPVRGRTRRNVSFGLGHRDGGRLVADDRDKPSRADDVGADADLGIPLAESQHPPHRRDLLREVRQHG